MTHGHGPDKMSPQWHAFVCGLQKLYEETGLRIYLDERTDPYSDARLVTKDSPSLPLPIFYSYLDENDVEIAVGYMHPAEAEKREQARIDARMQHEKGERERAEYERLRAKYGNANG